MNLDRFQTKEDAIAYLKTAKGFKRSKDAEAYLRKMIPHEPHYQDQIMKFLKKMYPGAFFWKATAGEYSRGGIPDVCMLIDSKFLGFEVKRPYFGKVSELQKDVIRKAKANGCLVSVVTFPEEVGAIIEDMRRI